MKPIEKDELFNHLGEFLKTKGVELKDGSYAQTIQKSCGMLTDVINLSQKGMEKAKTEVDKKLDQLRQCIHEKTAPKPGASTTATCTTTANTTVVSEAKAAEPKARTATSRPRKPKAKARKPKSGKAKS